jgi:hypothetical protein
MWRVEVREAGGAPLPAIDVADDAFVIGSSPDARVRLPAGAARHEHVRVRAGVWELADGAPGDVGGVRRAAIGDGVELAIGTFRVRVAPAPVDAVATPPQRTESLARELMRAMLGESGAPSLEVERGPIVGARRRLAPPESVLVIGRGDDAAWSIADEDLSRLHAEVRRGWDGIRVVDLGSRNGTRVDGEAVPPEPPGTLLRDGAILSLGRVVIRFSDPASPRSEPPPRDEPAPPALPAPLELRPPPASPWIFYAALLVMSAAIGAAAWLLLA